jgi:hypothetical protein
MFTHYGPKSPAEKWRGELHTLRRGRGPRHTYPKPEPVHPEQLSFDADDVDKLTVRYRGFTLAQ